MKVVVMIDAREAYGHLRNALLEEVAGFASMSSEPTDPKMYVSMRGVTWWARTKKRGLLKILMEVLDHETAHLTAFLYSGNKNAGWNEAWAKRFVWAGRWARTTEED